MSTFKAAVKHESKLRMALIGPSGSGKTFSALRIAHGLADGGRIAYIDTENGSASKYAGEPNPDGGDFTFDTVNMQPPYHPDILIRLMNAAVAEGYAVLVVDSLSHFWNGPGGLLEEVDKAASRSKSANSFAAWKDVTPIHNRLLQALTSTPVHLIGCMRSKTEYVLEQVEKNGRTMTVPRKIGTAPVQRDGMEFEFDVVADLDLDHRLLISKTRCRALDGGVIEKPGADVAATLRQWLGGAPQPAPKAPAANGNGGPAPTNGPITDDDLKKLAAHGKAHDIAPAAVSKLAEDRFGRGPRELRRHEFNALWDRIDLGDWLPDDFDESMTPNTEVA